MRVTNQMKRSQLLIDLERQQRDVFDSQRILNSGKLVSSPSDDPAAARKIMQLAAADRRRDQHTQNIDDGIARLGYTEAQLGRMDDLMSEARSIVIQTSNGAIADEDRAAVAERVDEMVYEIVSIANSRHEEQYIFGGYNTQEAPYEILKDPATGEAIGVQDQAQGMDGAIYRITADGEKIQINVPGTDIFQTGDPGDSGDLFQILIDFRDALKDGVYNDEEQDPPLNPGDPGYDPTAPVYTRPQYDSKTVISETLDKLDAAAEFIRGARARVGGSVKRLMNTKDRHLDLDIREDEHRSNMQDADLVEWITKFQLQSIALEQAMQVSSKVLNTSLVNFIR